MFSFSSACITCFYNYSCHLDYLIFALIQCLSLSLLWCPLRLRRLVVHIWSSLILTQPRKSFPSDDGAQLLLSCSFPDYFVCYFVPPCDMQYPPQPSVM